MSRLRWPDLTNSVSEKPGTIQVACPAGSPFGFAVEPYQGQLVR